MNTCDLGVEVPEQGMGGLKKYHHLPHVHKFEVCACVFVYKNIFTYVRVQLVLTLFACILADILGLAILEYMYFQDIMLYIL